MTTSDDNDCLKRVNDFFSVLKQKLKSHREVKRYLDRFLSADFNVFEWIDPDENRFSDIIEDLLDQNGAHGQQRKFLDAFLQVIKRPDLKDKKSLEVHREFPITHGRIDILVRFEHFGLAIENKLEAPEGKQQLQRYHDYLKEEYGDDGFCLVFLTPDGHKPESIEGSLREKLMGENKLICISYRDHMLTWMDECCQLCESDKFRWFLRDFRDHMNGGQTMSMRNERDIILKHALEKENLETALDINSAFNGNLNEEIIRGFLNKLEGFVLGKLRKHPDESKWYVNNKTLLDSPLPPYADFSFGIKSWKEQYGVGLQLQRKDNADKARKVMIGVWKPKNDLWPSELEERLRNKLNSVFGLNGKQAKEWPWYYYLDDPDRNWNGKKALIKLHNGEAVKIIGPYLVRIIKVAAPIIDAHVKDLGKKRS